MNSHIISIIGIKDRCLPKNSFLNTIKVLKIGTTKNYRCNFTTIVLEMEQFGTKCKNLIANRVDLDQTAPLGAVWSGSALFARPGCPILRIFMVLGTMNATCCDWLV